MILGILCITDYSFSRYLFTRCFLVYQQDDLYLTLSVIIVIILSICCFKGITLGTLGSQVTLN